MTKFLMLLSSSLLRAPLAQERHVHYHWPPEPDVLTVRKRNRNDVVPDMPFCLIVQYVSTIRLLKRTLSRARSARVVDFGACMVAVAIAITKCDHQW